MARVCAGLLLLGVGLWLWAPRHAPPVRSMAELAPPERMMLMDLGLCDHASNNATRRGAPRAPRRLGASERVAAEPAYARAFWGRVAFPSDGVPPFEINTHDPVAQDVYISASVHRGARWDPFLWTLLAYLLAAPPALAPFAAPPVAVVVDVGANLGYFSLMAAALGHRVVAFEPMGRNAAKLQASIARNAGFSERIALYQNAVASRAGEVVALAATHPSNQGNGQVVVRDAPPRGGGALGGVYGIDYVETVRLDDVVAEDVLVMKIDIEGLEAEALNGARGLLCGHVVRYVVIEFSEETRRSARCPARRMLRTLEALGYAISDIILGAAPLAADDDEVVYPPNLLFTLVNASVAPGRRGATPCVFSE